MLFVLVALWGTAIILLVLNPRNEAIRWLSGVAFCGGCGAMAVVLGDLLLPSLYRSERHAMLANWLEWVRIGCSIISYYGLTYAYLMFAISYNPPAWISSVRKYLPGLLLLPAGFMFIFTPIYTVNNPELYPLLALWAIPYVIAGTVLILLKKEYNPLLRRNHYIMCISVITPVVYSSTMNYLLPSFGLYEMWRFNTWMIILAVSVFLFALFNYGFLGIQLFIQRRQLDSALKAITSGTAFLNHAIKNDVGKASLFSDKIRRYAIEQGNEELLADIEVISRSTAHIQSMISRVSDQTSDLALRLQPVWLLPIVEEALAPLRSGYPELQLVTALTEVPSLRGDRDQLLEVLNNVLSNAVEAMDGVGTITVNMYTKKNKAIIEIIDDGPGIAKAHLKSIWDPFFTTKKKSESNFGLGLAYSYNAIRKHGGRIQMDSELGNGTAVHISLPLTKRN